MTSSIMFLLLNSLALVQAKSRFTTRRNDLDNLKIFVGHLPTGFIFKEEDLLQYNWLDSLP